MKYFMELQIGLNQKSTSWLSHFVRNTTGVSKEYTTMLSLKKI